MKIDVYVTLKKTVLDPQGKTIKHALEVHGFPEVTDVRFGKYIQIELDEPNPDMAARKVEQMCQKLLANPVIETYRYEILDEVPA